jgi:hypothetical protein
MDKQAFEQYRVRKFSNGHPGLQKLGPGAAETPADEDSCAEPDQAAVIIAFDIDCFYAQAEEVRRGC